ncbi:thiol:disulfide interchange protein DsbA/DsbL [Agaribacterium haliotis]|uniref:thiol:disulfide interchange protein DsbA/DsbL n=1 Tax=Agaribacterium haliotis TaxID=2013869 RepID=UPI000BB56066|nr:thiol:disulfide interchange protein DsbA/DsbL [Agaribacterium haliotis]
MRYWMLLLGFFVSLAACAEDKSSAIAAEKYVENKHYTKLLAPVPTIVGEDKVEVTEVFRFGCPACARFEVAAKKWSERKADYVELVKNPVVWNKDTKIRAQVYFTGKKLGVGQETADAMFAAIHNKASDPKAAYKALLKEDDIFAMFESLGVEREKAEKMYNNWTVKSMVNQADGRARAFAIAGTPEIFVDGRYRITTSMAGSYEQMLDIASWLAAKIAAERGIQ